MKSFDDKVAAITGAASGIGRACCEELAAVGAHVVLGDIAEEIGEQAVAEITTEKGGVRHWARAGTGAQ